MKHWDELEDWLLRLKKLCLWFPILAQQYTTTAIPARLDWLVGLCVVRAKIKQQHKYKTRQQSI